MNFFSDSIFAVKRAALAATLNDELSFIISGKHIKDRERGLHITMEISISRLRGLANIIQDACRGMYTNLLSHHKVFGRPKLLKIL